MAALLFMCLTACTADKPMNPSFTLTWAQAEQELHRMQENPVTLQRPVVVLNGWLDPGLASHKLVSELKDCGIDAKFVQVAFFGASDFEQCRQRLLDAVQEELCKDGQKRTPRVDVVAFSMGGLVARYSALSAEQRAAVFGEDEITDDGRRLRIVRLFTISTPHRGARMAGWVPWDGLARAMRADSSMVAELNAVLPEQHYKLYPYVRLGDGIVGSVNAAPPGRYAWWVANPFLANAHLDAHKDPRIVTDIAARLRGEPPYATRPAAPLPTEEDAPSKPSATSQAAQVSR